MLLGTDGDDFHPIAPQEARHRIKHRRFSEARFFSRYFRLSMDSADVSKATVEGLLNAIQSPDNFIQELGALESQGVILDALDQLLAEEIPTPENPSPLLAKLIDWWEERLLGRETSWLDHARDDLLLRLCEVVLGTRRGHDRLTMLQGALSRSKGVFSIQKLVLHEQKRGRERQKSNELDRAGLLDESDEKILCDDLSERILKRFRDAPLEGRSNEVEACFWAMHSGGSHRRKIGEELLRSPWGMVTLLRGTLGRFGDLTTVGELRTVGHWISEMIEIETLYKEASCRSTDLRELDPKLDEWLNTLQRIRGIDGNR
ncbi:MAG: hypothetical protein WCR07_15710 [Verrucomicrobiota bacterium]|jgi:hypothetical protein